MEEKQLKVIILDGELMPWKALGRGLISEKFGTVKYGVKSEFEALKQFGLMEEFQKVVNKHEKLNFRSQREKKNKTELRKEFGDVDYRNFLRIDLLLSQNINLDPDQNLEVLESFSEQIKLVGLEGELEYKPFVILKRIQEDGTELFEEDLEITRGEIFDFVSVGEEHLTLKIDPETNQFNLKEATGFWEKTTIQKQMEGIVIKPNKETPYVAPYMKVRNPEYLTMVYGYNYRSNSKYRRLLKQKEIQRKLRTSIKEWELGKALLRIPLHP